MEFLLLFLIGRRFIGAVVYWNTCGSKALITLHWRDFYGAFLPTLCGHIAGLTIHYVDEGYDTGEIIFQAKVPVYPDDTPDRLAARILRFEHLCYPPVLEMVIESSEG